MRAFSRLLLFFICFLPAAADLGDFVQHFVNGSGRVPFRTEIFAFVASLSASAALVASFKRRYESTLLPKLVGLWLFSMTTTFASVMYDLRACQLAEVEEFYCYWTFWASIWILTSYAGLLGIYPWKWGDRIPDPEPYRPDAPMHDLLPALFLSHGSPMLALANPESDPYVATLRNLGTLLPKPKALVFISAHWYVPGKWADVSVEPKTIHDFYGFPKQLGSMEYPADGFPEIMDDLDSIFGKGFWTGKARGLDHGVWTTLVHLRPESDIPVTTLSLDSRSTPDEIFEIGRKLGELRKRGYLVIGSGNVEHDLSTVDFSRGPGSEPHAFVKAFDDAFKDAVERRDFETLCEPYALPGGVRSVPTPEHYLPALAVLGAASPEDGISWIFEGFELWSIGRRSFMVGNLPERKRPKIILVAAMGEGNRVIGKEGSLPWHLPEDLAHFKEMTHGKTVVMGRRTYQSLPDKFRPLPGRRNVVITSGSASDIESDSDKASRIETFPSLDTALDQFASEGLSEVFVIGGAQLYQSCISDGVVDEIRLSIIPGQHQGDTFLPEFEDRYQETSSETKETFRYAVYEKNRPVNES